MRGWDVVIDWYKAVEKERGADDIAKRATCMIQVLTALKAALDARSVGASPRLDMFTTELSIANPYHVSIVCINGETGTFSVALVKNYREVLKQTEVSLSNVVDEIMAYLERPTQFD